MNMTDFQYTFRYQLSYQEAYDTFYALATRLTRRQKWIYGVLLAIVATLFLVFYGMDTRKVYCCVLAIWAIMLLFYLLYYPMLAARKGAAKVAGLAGEYQFSINQQGQISFPKANNKDAPHIITLGEDKYSRVLELDSLYAIRADAQTTLCLPKHVLKTEQKINLDRMFRKRVNFRPLPEHKSAGEQNKGSNEIKLKLK